ncbi:protein of unknown function (DUF4363) [Schinkia azotoformans MEV2011]|uniref:DUF4363 family protein n=1 Tax=Schinkia azotoformans MEV2011 TaxID=1348973 RepID=A0A072NRW5_SCHAZ|nr:DUF4363 family protein [Schinkia azotoformans]KEF35960.1 protein of unknown function (DUF4363) [Schinkia azotoformans MEV2011]MEC1694524.1 DUF4363 family protein [Schinkia azotoformans]MEC1716542.1 DUF4363 family protein [Schinkia azotoformans]MEC1725254.1 DUF4363 family protein [Schinkia azotoformans]MEC1739380.1 DUF4363 family protein [Schinkia azotoformans]
MQVNLKFIMMSVCFFMLVGCSDEKIKNKPIYQKSEEIMDLLNHSQWEKAGDEAKAISDLYKKSRWKLQLLGGEMEYSELEQEISKLKISIEEKDKREAKTNIVLIQDYIKAIYFR